jgi:hypothetical protein
MNAGGIDIRLRLMRRPPEADIPLQFLNESETSDQVEWW